MRICQLSLFFGEDELNRISAGDLARHIQDGGETYKVVHKPFIAIRSTPSTSGKICGTAMFQQHVDTFGWDEGGAWRKIFGLPKTSKLPLGNPLAEAWSWSAAGEDGVDRVR